MQTRQKVEQIKAYFSATENPHNPHHAATKDTKGCSLGRGKSWMGKYRGLNTASVPADRAQANQGLGKKLIPVSL